MVHEVEACKTKKYKQLIIAMIKSVDDRFFKEFFNSHKCINTLTDSDSGLDLVDKLSATYDTTIITGKEEINHRTKNKTNRYYKKEGVV
jgi:hypothetical protein